MTSHNVLYPYLRRIKRSKRVSRACRRLRVEDQPRDPGRDSRADL